MTLKKGRLKEIVKELQGASKMHLKQSEEIAEHIDDMNPVKMNSPLNFPGANSSNSSCWDGYRKDGVKDSPSGTGETVNNCVKIGSPANKKGKYEVGDFPLPQDNPSGLSEKNTSYVQEDKNGRQYITGIGDNESRPDVNNDYTNPTGNNIEIDGKIVPRDTTFAKGKVFKSKHNKKDLKKKLWVQGYPD